jgi:hypothetical protein
VGVVAGCGWVIPAHGGGAGQLKCCAAAEVDEQRLHVDALHADANRSRLFCGEVLIRKLLKIGYLRTLSIFNAAVDAHAVPETSYAPCGDLSLAYQAEIQPSVFGT